MNRPATRHLTFLIFWTINLISAAIRFIKYPGWNQEFGVVGNIIGGAVIFGLLLLYAYLAADQYTKYRDALDVEYTYYDGEEAEDQDRRDW